MADSEPRYRLEHSVSDKAGCQQAACKRENIKIKKGELRLGIDYFFEPADEWRTRWRHWRCVTPFQLKTMVENWAVTEIRGFKKLNDAAKEQVRKSYSAGHVVDTSFLGLPTDKSEKELKKAAAKVEGEATDDEEEKTPEAIAYKIDVATRLAMCRDPSCMEQKSKIPVGELRLGIIYSDKKSTWMYKHWMCTTAADLQGASKMKDAEELEGYDELPDEYKTTITRSFRHKKPYQPSQDVTSKLEALKFGE